jgi:hypothetical protein
VKATIVQPRIARPGSGSRPLPIVEVEQLAAALRTRPPPLIRIDIAELTRAEQQDWERALNRALRSCGCDEGTVGVIVAAGAVALSGTLGRGSGWLPRTRWARAGGGLGLLAAGAVVGKGAGITRGHHRARRLAGDLEQLVSKRRHDDPPHAS